MSKLIGLIKKNPLIRNLYYSAKPIYSFFAGSISANYVRAGKVTKVKYYGLYQLKNKAKYSSLLLECQRLAVNRIKQKGVSDRIKLAFQTASLSTWTGDTLLYKFLEDKRFDVSVVLTWQKNLNKEREFSLLEKHFSDNKIKYIIADGKVSTNDFDLIVFTSPYINALDFFSGKKISAQTLVVYIPYGFLLAGIQQTQYNHFIHNIAWRNYVCSKMDIKMGDSYCDIGSKSMHYSGYPKMDAFYIINRTEEYSWKEANSEKKPKRILYAPHHSINHMPFFSTFHLNKDFFLNYATEHQDTTSWVLKPHPLLRSESVRCGVFSSLQDYDSWIGKWRRLPNASVEEGEYIHIMRTSDAIILDSVSFLAEYMYTHKPMLLLERDDQKFNEFGIEIRSIVYRACGDDFFSIKEFIEKTIDHDNKRPMRKNFFSMYLDYYQDNGMIASDYIYNDIIQGVCHEENDHKP